MTTVTTTIRGHGIAAAARRAAWLAWAAFLLAFAILEGVNHGAAAWAALAGGLIAPDLTFFAAAGAREPVSRGQLPRQAVPFSSVPDTLQAPAGARKQRQAQIADVARALLEAEGPRP